MNELFLYAEVVIPAFIALAGAIIFLFRDIRAQATRAAQDQRETLRNYAELKEEVGMLKGKSEGIYEMSRAVIAEIRTIKDHKDKD